MTNEEAKEWLKAIKEKYIHGGDEGFDAKRKEAISMAIKALEQSPCEDCISRQAVLDLAKKGFLVSNGNYESVCKAINDLPSVNPQEPKTGHWIDVDGIFFKCSECDAYRKMMPAYKEYYCPNCGAKMAESEVNDADSN